MVGTVIFSFVVGFLIFGFYLDYTIPKIPYGEPTIFNTKQTYNGTVGYDGLYSACQQEKPRSVPCTSTILIYDKFWNKQVEPAWILDLQMNCVGYTSDNANTIGLCVQTQYGRQVIPCSCNMEISVCCF